MQLSSCVRPTIKFLSDEGVKQVHQKTLDVMENVGLIVEYDKALSLLSDAGAKVDWESKRVHFPRSLVEDCLKKIPGKAVYGARNPKYDFVLKPREGLYTRPIIGCVGYLDLETDKYREAVTPDLVEFTRLSDGLDHLSYCAAVFPKDTTVDIRDVIVAATMLMNTEKHILVQPYGGQNFSYMLRIAEAVQGSKEAIRQRPLFTVLTSTMPLRLQTYCLETVMMAGEYGIPVELNDQPMSGVTGPVTIAGLLTIANADVLGAVVVAQLANPGTPVAYVPRAMVLDMRTGAGLMSSVENAMLVGAQAQLAIEAYGMPTTLFGPGTDGPITDSQSQIERVFNVLFPVLAGSNVVAGMGQVQNALVVSPVQLVIDDDIVGMIRRVLRGIEVNDETLGVDVIARQAGGANLLMDPHTLKYYQTEYFMPHCFNRMARQVWESEGSKDMNERARDRAREILKRHQVPPLDEAVVREVNSIVAHAEKAVAEGKIKLREHA